ncbi:MAG: ABC transporter ATP-binding protein [Rhodospirillales bacterium]|nr:ABC transporter ATP-binding protein [Rhodospirillales bacterium]
MLSARAHSLHIRNLCKHYGRVKAVDDVSFTVARGSFLTLLGPSGSGKTTILMAIAGFVDPTSGDILVDDRVITTLPPEQRNFGMVFQGYALFPHLSVGDNVAFPLNVRKRPKSEVTERVKQALDLVQLGHLADRMPKQLSGGQQQRVALARALVFQPEMLLLDEPLSALDKKLRAELQWELKSLHERVGMTFIYVTHDQEEALTMSDEVAILRDGKIVQSGPPSALYETPRTRFVADFLGKSNFLSGTIEAADGQGFTYRCGQHRFAQARGTGRPGDSVLVSLRPEKLDIAADKPAAPANAIPADILRWSYFGTGVHFQLQAEGIGEVTVTRPSWRLAAPLEVGKRVWLTWDADATTPVADDLRPAS